MFAKTADERLILISTIDEQLKAMTLAADNVCLN